MKFSNYEEKKSYLEIVKFSINIFPQNLLFIQELLIINSSLT